MTRLTLYKTLTLAVLFAMVVGACAAPAAPAAAPAGEAAAPAAGDAAKQVLRVAYDAEIDTLNALTSQNAHRHRNHHGRRPDHEQ